MKHRNLFSLAALPLRCISAPQKLLRSTGFRKGIALGAALLFALPAHADSVGFAKALEAAQKGNVATAMAGMRGADQVEKKLLQWELLKQQNVKVPFDQYTSFLSHAKGWPELTTIQLRAEEVFPDNYSDAQVISWYQDRRPLTSRGLIRYATALQANGDRSGAQKAVSDYFTTRDFGLDSALKVMTAFQGMISNQDVATRVDKLIWEGKYSQASDLLQFLPNDMRRVPAARIALLTEDKAADSILGALSSDEQNDPGVAFARARWRREMGFDSSAAVILARINAPALREEDVAQERAILARRMFERSDFGGAYAVVSAQPAVQGQNATQNLWYAGWLALRFKQDTANAAKYFQAFYDNVQTPVSRSRGAYWLGRTAEAAGQSDVARQWYQVAAASPTFYGQLASEKLGTEFMIPPHIAKNANSPVLSDDRLDAAKLLARTDNPNDARAFYKAVLNDISSEQDFATAADWALRNHQPQWAVHAGKAAQLKGFVGLREAYPILPTNVSAEFDGRVEPALAHALIRQESEFDQNAKSKSGALGLMQLMPKTAAYVAKKMGIKHTQAALTTDPSHNVQLGSRYIADQMDGFNNPYLAIAAYNAGPGRVKQWLGVIGDPRNPRVDAIDWIESIPVYETRNYVQRVTENQNIYRALLGQSIASR